jgi:hypothetical protein
MKNDFGIAGCTKAAAARLQLISQLDVIEDLAIECNRHIAIDVRHRLLTVLQTNDRKAPTKTPLSSGPRWAMASVMRLSNAAASRESTCVPKYPTKPHIVCRSGHCERSCELRSNGLTERHCLTVLEIA